MEKAKDVLHGEPAGAKACLEARYRGKFDRVGTDSRAEWRFREVVQSVGFGVSVLPTICVTLGKLVITC